MKNELKILTWKYRNKGLHRPRRMKFTHHHVNAWADMMDRNVSIPHELVCITDDPEGIDKRIRCIDINEIDNGLMILGDCYVRLSLFRPEVAGKIGDRIVSMDLDCVVLDNIDKFVDRPEPLVLMDRDKLHIGGSGRTSFLGGMWLMSKGAYPELYYDFDWRKLKWQEDRILDNKGALRRDHGYKVVHAECIENDYVPGSDQAWISYRLRNEKPAVWTGRGVQIFRLKKPEKIKASTKIVFTPDPFSREMQEYDWVVDNYGEAPEELCRTFAEKAIGAKTTKKGDINRLRFLCWKWENRGLHRPNRAQYTGKHVNKWADMVNENCNIPHDLVCITDDPGGIDENKVTVMDIPDKELLILGDCYVRLQMFDKRFQNMLGGEKLVSMDLDCIITGKLDPLFNRENDFTIWSHRWGSSKQRVAPYCGSMWMVKNGSMNYIWQNFQLQDLSWKRHHKKSKDEDWGWRCVNRKAMQKGFKVGSDQAWIAYCCYPDKASIWRKRDGVYNFNQIRDMGLPDNARIVFFAGAVEPDDKKLAKKNKWMKKYY